ncbi:TetR/AcrR family transcriptional regulator [Rhodococcus sp. NPDC060176]|uniref:TetR/AcrR family transcriptional regulator n=1 Tax=Rhodococcus sp. NPDC060176 TaxID=3347062 RepID=UPI0036514772
MSKREVKRMTAQQRREQLLALAAEEFAAAGLHGASMESLAHRAGISQAYIFRLFGTKKALFLQVVQRAFTHLIDGMGRTAADTTGPESVAVMGEYYNNSALSNRTELLVQLQAFAACGDREVRDAVRNHMSGMWTATADHTRMPPVAVKSFLAYGMLLNVAAALDIDDIDTEWARGIRTRIHAGLFDHLTEENNQ